ncbi:MAG: hypothetical protein ACYDHX_06280 [Methanothrix sp.]
MCENESIAAKIESLPKTDPPVQGTVSSFKPKTPLGQRLWSIRKRIVASGETLLGWDEIEKEVAARRGEAD